MVRQGHAAVLVVFRVLRIEVKFAEPERVVSGEG